MPRSSPPSRSPRADRHPLKPGKPCRITVTKAVPPTDTIILLVDDDPSVLTSLGRVLATEGWKVVTAANGEEALERLAEHQPDLMITDLRMGDVSGWDLLFHENMQRPNLPIFVITALPPPAVGGADHFAAEFFQKPLDIDALVAAIRRRLGAVPLMEP
jgi:two-component system, NtrC family, response regulator GlrR